MPAIKFYSFQRFLCRTVFCTVVFIVAIGCFADNKAYAQGENGEESSRVEISITNALTMPQWSPYIVGAGIGILSWFTFLLSNKPLGVSSAFAKTAGLIEMGLQGKNRVLKKPYYQKTVPKIDWGWMLVLGILVGAFIAAAISDDFCLAWIPAKWKAEVGTSVPLRLLVAVFGGICVGFGARWGNGCTSGHGISGTLQLSLSSWIAAICFFLGGIFSAMITYHVFA